MAEAAQRAHREDLGALDAAVVLDPRAVFEDDPRRDDDRPRAEMDVVADDCACLAVRGEPSRRTSARRTRRVGAQFREERLVERALAVVDAEARGQRDVLDREPGEERIELHPAGLGGATSASTSAAVTKPDFVDRAEVDAVLGRELGGAARDVRRAARLRGLPARAARLGLLHLVGVRRDDARSCCRARPRSRP